MSLSDALRRDGHLEMALEVCAMGVTLQDWPSLCCRSLHTLGALGKRKEMEQQLRDVRVFLFLCVCVLCFVCMCVYVCVCVCVLLYCCKVCNYFLCIDDTRL